MQLNECVCLCVSSICKFVLKVWLIHHTEGEIIVWCWTISATCELYLGGVKV